MLLFAALLACGPSFRDIQKADTIEAYEGFIAASPNSPSITMANIRLEELYLAKARDEKSLEAYDDYLTRYEGGVGTAALVEDAVEERETFLYDWAEEQNSEEGWQKYLDEYPKGDKKRKQEARRRLKMNSYIEFIEIGPVEAEPTNLAEKEDGPLDGFKFLADVTNNGDKRITTLNMELQYLGADGSVIDTDRWPLVAPAAPGNMPIEEEWKVPVEPGETRTYWFTDMAPEVPGWSKKTKLVAIGIAFDDDEGTQ
ncbi:MAG: hypothetical protein GY913_17390 [Proteobacteria bacterium]|nr:hypothetical protein [Pseudomonadota bacterium]MCP4918681.1 hypothetical protein [Pseudomonadota bacterium]